MAARPDRTGWRRQWLALPVLVALLGAIFATAPVCAGAWTRQPGEGLLILSSGVHQLSDDWTVRTTTKFEHAAYAEYGLSERITLVGRAAFQQLHRPDWVAVEGGGAQWQKPVTIVQRGIGGVEAGARFRLRQSDNWVVSGQVLGTIPVNGEHWNNARFGEGGGDVETRLLVGRGLWSGAYVDAQIAWRARPRAESSEVRLDLTAGARLHPRLHLTVQSYSVWGVASPDEQREGYASHRLQGSVIVPLGDRRKLQVSALTTVRRDGLAGERAYLISLWRTF